jgi:serine/threonine protein kinase
MKTNNDYNYQPKEIIANSCYEILNFIGEGGTGTVYLAKNKKNNEKVAIKALHQDLAEDAKQVEIFKHEAQLAAQLHHPNIVTVHDVINDHESGKAIYFLVMEYLPGGSLVAQIKTGVPVDQSIKWIKQLLEAVAYAHDKGIIHQDIKSANVFLTANKNVKIGDFGLAKLADGSYSKSLNDSSPYLNSSLAQKKGTPAYMSPELCYGEIQDERSDIYSLGVLFFELLTGQLPFEATGIIELAKQHISKPVPSIMRIKSSLPQILDDIVRRMMAKEKDFRYQSARQILQAIEKL